MFVTYTLNVKNLHFKVIKMWVKAMWQPSPSLRWVGWLSLIAVVWWYGTKDDRKPKKWKQRKTWILRIRVKNKAENCKNLEQNGCGFRGLKTRLLEDENQQKKHTEKENMREQNDMFIWTPERCWCLIFVVRGQRDAALETKAAGQCGFFCQICWNAAFVFSDATNTKPAWIWN